MKRKIYFLIFAVILFSLIGCSANTEKSNGSQAHDDDEDVMFEWSGEYELPAGEYELIFKGSDNGDSIRMNFLLKQYEREVLDHAAYHMMEREGDIVLPDEHFNFFDTLVATLMLNPKDTSFTFSVYEGGRYVIYTEHFAWEFDMKIIDFEGNEVEAENSVDHAEPH